MEEEIYFDENSEKIGSNGVSTKPIRRSFRSQGNLVRAELLLKEELAKQAEVLSEVHKEISSA